MLVTVGLFMVGRRQHGDSDRDLEQKIEEAVSRRLAAAGTATVPAADAGGATVREPVPEPPPPQEAAPEPMTAEEHPATEAADALPSDAIHEKFFDPDTGWEARLLLDRVSYADAEVYTLGRRIGFRSDRHEESFVFPTDLATFHTDFAPAPALFSWLIPATPSRIPALVLRDCLPYAAQHGEEPQYVGPWVDADEADRLFREALRYTGSGPVEAWLGWAAVNIATAWMSHDRSLVGRLPRFAWLPLLTLVNLVLWLPALDLVSGGATWLMSGRVVLDLILTAVVCAAAAVPASLTFGRRWRAPALLGALCGAVFPLLLVALVVAVVVRLATRLSRR